MDVDRFEPPLFLIAMPQIVDPFFNRSVVLLLEHTPDGGFGLIINRPLDVTVSSVSQNLGISWTGAADAHVFFGGPVQPTNGIMLFSDAQTPPPAAKEVAPSLWFANDVDSLRLLATTPPSKSRLFVGYAGWNGNQLDEEVGRNDWLVAPYLADILFESDPQQIWGRALESIGVRPEALPATTSMSQERGN